MNISTQPPSLKLIKFLHLIMIVLCLLASIALYTAPSVTVKLLISLLLIAYTFMLVTNSAPVRALFKLTNDQSNSCPIKINRITSTCAIGSTPLHLTNPKQIRRTATPLTTLVWFGNEMITSR
jgi:hypothetical protein